MTAGVSSPPFIAFYSASLSEARMHSTSCEGPRTEVTQVFIPPRGALPVVGQVTARQWQTEVQAAGGALVLERGLVSEGRFLARGVSRLGVRMQGTILGSR